VQDGKGVRSRRNTQSRRQGRQAGRGKAGEQGFEQAAGSNGSGKMGLARFEVLRQYLTCFESLCKSAWYGVL